MPNTGQRAAAQDWWRTAVIYEVYVRSFADGNGDGIGDLAGVRARLPYLAELGIDAIWFAPWYPSPMADAGYDVADYRAIEPLFGSLAEAEKLIAEAHALGIRIIIDIVPNHGSDQQQWFTDALAAPAGSAERARYHFRPGQGDAGSCRRTTGRRMFGGPAWSTVTTNADGTARGVVPAPVQPRAARLQLGPPGRAGRVRRRAAVLVRPRRGRFPHRLRRRCWPRTPATGPVRDAAAVRPGQRGTAGGADPARTRSSTGTRCTASTGSGGRSRTPTRGPSADR